MIELQNITKKFVTGDRVTEILRGITLTLPKRGLVCILGASGSGKTTFLNVLGGLDEYSSGVMKLDGRDFSTLTEAERNAYRNQKMGFVFQHSHLIGCLSVLENVAIKGEISGERESRERAQNALDRVGLGKFSEKKPKTLSGGEAQRVALARAIVNEPEIVLADEPTGALDSKSGRGVMALLKDLSCDRLVVVVTHNAALAEEYADRILEMEDGTFVADRALARVEEDVTLDKKPPQKVGLRFVDSARLAFRNFCHNGLRSALVSIACSVGVFGLAIVLTLFGWFNSFLAGLETTMLYAFPVTAGGALNYNSLLDTFLNPSSTGNTGKVQVNTLVAEVYKQLTVTKELSADYVAYVEKMDPALYNRIDYDYGIDWNANLFTTLNVSGVNYTASVDYLVKLAASQNALAEGALSSIEYFLEMPDGNDEVFANYELVAGTMPQSENELLLVLNEDGSTYDYILALLGFYSLTDIEEYLRGDLENFAIEWEYQDVLDKRYSLFNNDLVYTKNNLNGLFEQKTSFSTSVRPLSVEEGEGVNLQISGIVRSKLPFAQMALKTGLYYTKDLTNTMRAQAVTSAIVQEMQQTYADTQKYINPYTGGEVTALVFEEILRQVGGGQNPVFLNIFPCDMQSKEEVLSYLAAWNQACGEGEEVESQDIGQVLIQTINGVSEPAKSTLFALSLLSVLVAGGMSGIVALMSVRERQKEIGILRCMGAKNREIALAFCLESGCCGLLSGLIGVLVSYVVSAVFFASYALQAVWLPVWSAFLCIASLFALNMGFAALASLSLVRNNPVRALTQE